MGVVGGQELITAWALGVDVAVFKFWGNLLRVSGGTVVPESLLYDRKAATKLCIDKKFDDSTHNEILGWTID